MILVSKSIRLATLLAFFWNSINIYIDGASVEKPFTKFLGFLFVF